MYLRAGSNRHPLREQILSLSSIPVPPHRQVSDSQLLMFEPIGRIELPSDDWTICNYHCCCKNTLLFKYSLVFYSVLSDIQVNCNNHYTISANHCGEG